MLESSTNPIHVRQRDLYTQIGVMSEVNSKNKSSSYTDRRLREQSDFYIWKKDSIHGQHILVSQKFINLNFFCILHEIVWYSARSQKSNIYFFYFFFQNFIFLSIVIIIKYNLNVLIVFLLSIQFKFVPHSSPWQGKVELRKSGNHSKELFHFWKLNRSNPC